MTLEPEALMELDGGLLRAHDHQPLMRSAARYVLSLRIAHTIAPFGHNAVNEEGIE